jgi:hypothetical protein
LSYGAIVNNPSLIERELIEEEGLTLAVDKNGWWDEKYIPQVYSEINRTMSQFPTDEKEVYDQNGELSNIPEKVSKIFNCCTQFLTKLTQFYSFMF